MAPTSRQRKRQRSRHLTLHSVSSPSQISTLNSQRTLARTLHLSRTRSSRLPYYIGVSFLMLLWDWKVLLATLTGAGTIVLLPKLQCYPWQTLLGSLQKSWDHPHRPMAIAIVGGGCMAALTYLSLQIWLETQSHWLAAGVLLEGAGLTLVGAVGAPILLSRVKGQAEDVLDQNLADLTNEQPITRLLAIHHLSQLVSQRRLSPSQTQVVTDALALCLNQESEARLRHAALDSLALLRAGESGWPANQAQAEDCLRRSQ